MPDNGLIHQIQYQEVRDKSIQELPDRLSEVRLFIFSDALVPNWLGGFAFEGSGIAGHIEPPFISAMNCVCISICYKLVENIG